MEKLAEQKRSNNIAEKQLAVKQLNLSKILKAQALENSTSIAKTIITMHKNQYHLLHKIWKL